MKFHLFLLSAFVFVSGGVGLQAAPSGKIALPDFTKGDPIPEGANHDWNLGATGARGWTYSDKLVTTDARQIYVTKVEEASPSDGLLEVGDVILGVRGKKFSYDARTEMGKALSEAEAKDGKFSLMRWRKGEEKEVNIELPVLGGYSATAPYACEKSKRILEQGCEELAKRMGAEGYRENPIPRSLNALALLASGDEKYLPLVKKEVEWATEFSASRMQTWYYGYVTMLIAEYTLATGDKSFLQGLRRLAMESAEGQSPVGSWGHGFIREDGRLGGYGMMNAPGLPLTTSLVLARAAGVTDTELGRAVEKSTRLLRFYEGKGAIPYGDHHPWIQSHEDNGKCGMAAVLFNLLKEKKAAEFFSRMSVASHGCERDMGHTGNFFNMLWALPSVAQSGPQATGAWMSEFGGWYFDLARRWDGSFGHQGPPQTRNDSYAKWDATGAYLLAYALPLKKIYLTGKSEPVVPQLEEAEAEAKRLVLDGAGWNNKDRNGAYDAMNADTLFECLGSWSPVVRERAGMALARRKDVPIAALIDLLDSDSLEERYGASQAFVALKGKGAPAIEALVKNLEAEDLWLRIKSAEALAAIGKPAMSAVPKLLELMTEVDVEKDPRGMQQRYFSFALFSNRGGMLSRSLEGVDREVLFDAVRAGLKNEDGRARGSFGSVYRNLKAEQIEPLLPAILDAVNEPAPSGLMFADGIRLEGLQVLAEHKVEEGIQACVDYASSQNPWGSQKRVPKVMEILLKYGTNAKVTIPALRELAGTFAAGEKNFPKKLSLDKAASVEETIKKLEATKETPKLKRVR